MNKTPMTDPGSGYRALFEHVSDGLLVVDPDTGVVRDANGRFVSMIAGGNDTVVPPQQTRRIAERAPNGELLYYPDGDHVCKNRVTQYRPYAADWMRGHLTSQ